MSATDMRELGEKIAVAVESARKEGRKEMSAERDDALAQAENLRAALKAIDIIYSAADGFWLHVDGLNGKQGSLNIVTGMTIVPETWRDWKVARDKALLGESQPEPEEGFEVKTAEEMNNKTLPKGSRIWHCGKWIHSSREGQIIYRSPEIPFFAIPIVDKEPDTFNDLYVSHAEAFGYLCKHVTATSIDERATVQLYDLVLKKWYDIRIGQAMLLTDVGLTELRFKPKEK